MPAFPEHPFENTQPDDKDLGHTGTWLARFRLGYDTAHDARLIDGRDNNGFTQAPHPFSPMTQQLPATDGRLAALTDWARACLGEPGLTLAPASSDASFRRYFRVRFPDPGRTTLIAMDAPPPQEDCRPFVAVAALLAEAGVHVPAILHADLERGFMLLSDLGTQQWIDVLNADNADALMDTALDTLVRIQGACDPESLPPYDLAMLQRELDLVPNWYVGRHLGLALTPEEHAVWQDACRLLTDAAQAQAQVFVHRDYMPRNLMWSEPNPGVIDFQGALRGPIAYDVVSLFRDAFQSWPEARVRAWLRRYWDKARAAGLPVPAEFADFERDADWIGMQRHLKILGLFPRIFYRDGKPHYLGDLPRFLGYLREVGGRYPEFAPLLDLLASLQARAHAAADA